MCNRFVPSSSNCLWAVVSLSIPYHHVAACGHTRTGYEAAYTALLACVRLLLGKYGLLTFPIPKATGLVSCRSLKP